MIPVRFEKPDIRREDCGDVDLYMQVKFNTGGS